MSWVEMMEQQQRDIHDARREDEKAGRNRPELSPAAKERKARVDLGRQQLKLVENDDMRRTILSCQQRIDQVEDELFQGEFWSGDEDQWITGDRLMVAERADGLMDVLLEIRGMLQAVWQGETDRESPISVANEDGSTFGESEKEMMWPNGMRIKKGRK